MITTHGTHCADDITVDQMTLGGTSLVIGEHAFHLTESATLVLASKLLRALTTDD